MRQRILMLLILTGLYGVSATALEMECRQALAVTRGEAPSPRAFTTLTKGPNAFGFSPNTHWLLLNCQNIPLFSPVYLELETAHLDDVQIFAANDLKTPLFRLGDRLPYADRPIKVPHFAVPLTTDVLHTGVVLRVKSTGSLHIPIVFRSEKEFIEHHMERRLVQGLYFGLVFAIIFLNLWLFVLVRHPLVLHYVGYLSSFTLLQMAQNGWVGAYLLPNLPAVANWILPMSIWLTFAAILQLFRSLLKTDDQVPRLGMALFIAQFACFTMMGLSAFLPYSTLVRVALIVGLVAAPTLSGLSLWMSRRDSIAYFIMAAGAAFLLGSFGPWMDGSPELGSALKILILSAGVGFRLQLLRLEPPQDVAAPYPKNYFNLVELVSEVAGEARLIAKNVRIDLSVSKDESWFYGSQSDLKKALLNFVINSIEAESRWISIRLMDQGPATAVEIQDNGRGMTVNTLKKIRSGEPVSTKPNGAGLGLTSAFKTLHQNGARIVLDSRMGVGTYIQIAFPIVQDEPAPAEVTTA